MGLKDLKDFLATENTEFTDKRLFFGLKDLKGFWTTNFTKESVIKQRKGNKGEMIKSVIGHRSSVIGLCLLLTSYILALTPAFAEHSIVEVDFKPSDAGGKIDVDNSTPEWQTEGEYGYVKLPRVWEIPFLNLKPPNYENYDEKKTPSWSERFYYFPKEWGYQFTPQIHGVITELGRICKNPDLNLTVHLWKVVTSTYGVCISTVTVAKECIGFGKCDPAVEVAPGEHYIVAGQIEDPTQSYCKYISDCSFPLLTGNIRVEDSLYLSGYGFPTVSTEYETSEGWRWTLDGVADLKFEYFASSSTIQSVEYNTGITERLEYLGYEAQVEYQDWLGKKVAPAELPAETTVTFYFSESNQQKAGYGKWTQDITALHEQYFKWKAMLKTSRQFITPMISSITVRYNQIPGRVELVSPTSGLWTNHPRPIFSWLNSEDADGDALTYQLQISTTPEVSTTGGDFEVVMSSFAVTGVTSWQCKLATLTTWYYWRVRARDAYSLVGSSRSWHETVPGEWSAVWKIGVDTAPSSPDGSVDLEIEEGLIDNGYIETYVLSESSSEVQGAFELAYCNPLIKPVPVKSKTYRFEMFDQNGKSTSPVIGMDIKLDYQEIEADNDGFIDGTMISESYLRVFKLNNDKWELVETEQFIDPDENKISLRLNSLGTYTLLAVRQAPDELLSEAHNIPNPFKPSEEEPTQIWYVLQEESEVTLKIYNLVGDLVRVICEGETRDSGPNYEEWDGKNDAGRVVANGMYICWVRVEPTDLTTEPTEEYITIGVLK